MNTDKVTSPTPLQLTSSNYWQELETLAIEQRLANCLKSMISSMQDSTIEPTATDHLIRLAKKHLGSGIIISDSAGTKAYDVMVYVPDNNKDNRRRFFKLIAKHPDGKLYYLEQL